MGEQGEQGERNGRDDRVAVIGIIVENPDSVEALNGVLHEYADHVVGRMGIPYRRRGINIIALALDAPQETISALTGRVGNLKGVSVKAAYAKSRRAGA